MRSTMTAEAASFGQVVEDAVAAAGGIELARAAAATGPSGPEREKIAALLGELGVWEIDPAADPLQAEVAGAVCRAAGRYALPYPVAERLAAGGGEAAIAFAPDLAAARIRLQHADLALGWRVHDLAGLVAAPADVRTAVGGKLGTFVCPVRLGPSAPAAGPDPVARLLTLQAWTLLGMIEQASRMTYRYVQERQQFGHPLAHFQAVQFVLTDVAVAVDGLAELAKYTLWAIDSTPARGLQDAIALRLAALEAAESTFRAGHQLHGAIGFCDETPISWLSRLSQPLRRLPWGLSQTEAALLELVEGSAFSGPFERVEPAQ